MTHAKVTHTKQRIHLLSERVNELTERYRWKAENIVRFFDGLGMTTEEKVEFLAKEFANVRIFGAMHELTLAGRNEANRVTHTEGK